MKKKKKHVTAMARRKIPLQQGHTHNKVKQTAVNFQQLRDNEEDDVSNGQHTMLLSLSIILQLAVKSVYNLIVFC